MHDIIMRIKHAAGLGMLLLLFVSSVYANDMQQEGATVPPTVIDEKAGVGTRVVRGMGYAWRIVTAPVMICVRYPRDEETDLYQTYLAYVNKGTGRRWKHTDLQVKKKISLDNTSEQENEPTVQDTDNPIEETP